MPPEPILKGWYHEDGSACVANFCMRPHPLIFFDRDLRNLAFPVADKDVTLTADPSPSGGLDTWDF